MVSSKVKQAEAIARQAGALLVTLFNPTGVPASYKEDHSLVTEADLASDQMISQALQENYSSAAILSEERLTELDINSGEVWVIDPLDGTTNFSLGLQYWGISIANLNGGIPDATAIYFPLLDEMYTASRGEGAFLNNRRITLSQPNPGHTAPFFSCCSRTYRRYKVNIPYKTRILGSGTYSLCSVASGRAIVGFEATAKIWDIAGAWLIVTEAGGAIELYQGDPPFPLQTGINYAKVNLAVLAAGSPELLAKARSQITSI